MNIYRIIYSGFLNQVKDGCKVLTIKVRPGRTRTCDPVLRSQEVGLSSGGSVA
jgi:hypothetical protein